MENIFRSAAFFFILLFVASCSNNTTTDTSPALESETSIKLKPPMSISSARSINSANLNVDIRVNGQRIFTSRVGDTDTWSGEAFVPEGDEVFFSVTWYENFQTTTRLDLAHWQDTMLVNSSLQVHISPDEYTTSNEVLVPDNDYFDAQLQFDYDDDGFSNIEERNADSNALDINSTPDSIPAVDVIIPVSTFRSPNVDGNYSAEDYETQNAIFRDTSKNRLSIDNLLKNAGTTQSLLPRSDGNSEMKWFAIHDNTYLYIAVLGEDVELSTPHRDSGVRAYDDDNLNIYLDTNNSAGSSYDRVDDYHIMIPLLNNIGESNISDNANRSFVIPEYSAALDIGNIKFATCGNTCGTSGQHLWEVRIPLNAIGLSPGTVFGIDIQLDIDNDGGERDSKWAWSHPSGSDTTWQNPSMMAKGFIQ